jgi:FtsH-binding integral membrane protein
LFSSYLNQTGGVIIEAASLTFVVVFSLTMYTFWAAKKGHDFSFLGPFLFAACLILMFYGLIQVTRSTKTTPSQALGVSGVRLSHI